MYQISSGGSAMLLVPSASCDEDDDDDDDEPPLVAAVTEDYDEQVHPRHTYNPQQQGGRIIPTVVQPHQNNNKNKAAYVSRYGVMVQRQEAEDLATQDHLQHCLERLEQIIYGSSSTIQHQKQRDDITTIWERTATFADLRRALDRLEGMEGECLTTDPQLVMVLNTILQQTTTASVYREETNNASLTWAELVQCYKTCVAGMQALQNLPGPSLARDRSRDRTVAMMSLFDEPSTKAFSKSSVAYRRRQDMQKNATTTNRYRMTRNQAENNDQSAISIKMPVLAAFLAGAVIVSSAVGFWAQPYVKEHWLAAERNNINENSSDPTPFVAEFKETHIDTHQQPVTLISSFTPKAYATSLPESKGMSSLNKSDPLEVTKHAATTTTTTLASSETQKPITASVVVAIPTTATLAAGALVIGPVAAVLAQAWQAGGTAVALGPAIVFGAGLVTLGSVAIHSVRLLLLQLLSRLRRQAESPVQKSD